MGSLRREISRSGVPVPCDFGILPWRDISDAVSDDHLEGCVVWLGLHSYTGESGTGGGLFGLSRQLEAHRHEVLRSD